jgi:hypothetical protein
VIKAKPEVVFAQVADLRAWKNWGVWFERDPQMQITYSETRLRSAAGRNGKANRRATAKRHSPGSRRLPRSSTVCNSKGWVSRATGSFALIPRTDGVRVVWADTGDLGLNPLSRWFGLFLDRMIGPDFAAGLAKLRSFCEKMPH